MPRVYFPTPNNRRVTIEKGGGGGSHHISDDTYQTIIKRFHLRLWLFRKKERIFLNG
jgi:hypothetical protein